MKTWLILLVYLLPASLLCYSQKVPTIHDIDFSIIDNKLVIRYNIANFRHNNKFNIKAEIFKASGEKINAISFTGDLTEVQTVTDNKIIWDMERDNIALDDDIYIVISGEVINEPVAEKTGEKPGIIQVPLPGKQKVTAPVNRTACFFKSVAFPGWGTSELTLKKGHLVKGFLGYGAITGSIVMNLMRQKSLDAYDAASTSADRDLYYKEQKNRRTASIIFGIGAGTVWSVDLISVLTAKNRSSVKSASGMNVKFGYARGTENTNQLICKINF